MGVNLSEVAHVIQMVDIGSDKFEPDLLEQPKQTSKPLILVQNQSY
jgi:hypothetical protein